MRTRELIVRVNGKGTDEGAASVLASWLGPMIEIVATEMGGGDAAVLLTEAQTSELIRALTAALEQAHGNRAS